jgi:hypothetical protein
MMLNRRDKIFLPDFSEFGPGEYRLTIITCPYVIYNICMYIGSTDTDAASAFSSSKDLAMQCSVIDNYMESLSLEHSI